MSRINAGIDQNAVKSLLAVSSADGVSVVVVWADPVTHALLVKLVGGAGYQQPTGTVDGTNQTFVFATAPNVISVDQGRVMQKVSSDGTVNWTGTKTVVLSVAPTFDIFGIN